MRIPLNSFKLRSVNDIALSDAMLPAGTGRVQAQSSMNPLMLARPYLDAQVFVGNSSGLSPAILEPRRSALVVGVVRKHAHQTELPSC
jgi:hypothetical protein